MALPGKLMSLAHEFADKNKIEQMFNRTAKLVGKNWVLAFCRRQNLMLHTPEKCRLGRAIEFNKIQCEGFHNNLVSVCAEKKFPAHPKFNVDESGERGQTVTVVCCIFVPPAMIFARKWMKPELFTDAPEGTLPMISDTGFINTELFVEWLKHFTSFVKPTKEDPVLLILDNHIAHCSIEAVLFCREHHITLLSLPPHASHSL
ncbi:hypothetical protein B7P43_G07304 [Cryptotermes secundus]|uniref:DDE-1 domain-containing protein n=1 Tax=Cryptotermes secundus TaxID=105785 RepID=A0A2J7PSK6_9NEOP|nr:hypothetical protein B7P43_G07304 [Cryptotermes secundus]